MIQLIPRIKRLTYSREVLMERPLPLKGTLNVKVGDAVDPVTRLGMTKLSTAVSYIPLDLTFAKGKFDTGYFYTGEKIGRSKLKKVIAPFDGYMSKSDKSYIFTQEPKEHWLLSGVWGKVEKKIESMSVLIRTQTVDIKLAVCSSRYISGEFIVFPNPSDLLQSQYLENFSKDVYGKIIYLGEFATPVAVEKAVQLGVGGLIAGSTDKQTFEYAKSQKIFIGLINGFGRIETPDYIFDFIKEVSNRYVFIQGERNLLRIPIPQERLSDIEPDLGAVLVKPVVGMRVQIFQKPYYGYLGTIKDVQEGVIYVTLNQVAEPVEVPLHGVLAVD